MKRIFLICVFALSINGIDAQSSSYLKSDDQPILYLGVGSGINNYTGFIGFSANVRVHNTLFVQGGLGIGGWGNKMSIGLRYDLKYEKGWSFGVGFSSCSGIEDMTLQSLELSSGEYQSVSMEYLRANTINLKAGYIFKLGRRNTFYLETGYGVALQSEPWIVKDGLVLSETSKQVMNLTTPGGLIFGFGFTFGLF